MLHIASHHQIAWANIPSAFLHAELTRREEALGKPPCGSGKARGSYNTSFHVAALILILLLSTGGESRSPTCSIQNTNPDEQVRSMLFSDHSAPLSSLSRSPSLSLPFPSLRHWRPHCDRLRASAPDGVCLAHRSLPTQVLESWISSHGRSYRDDIRAGGGGH